MNESTSVKIYDSSSRLNSIKRAFDIIKEKSYNRTNLSLSSRVRGFRGGRFANSGFWLGQEAQGHFAFGIHDDVELIPVRNSRNIDDLDDI